MNARTIIKALLFGLAMAGLCVASTVVIVHYQKQPRMTVPTCPAGSELVSITGVCACVEKTP